MNHEEPENDEGPGFGVWLSAIAWLFMIAMGSWAYLLWRNHL